MRRIDSDSKECFNGDHENSPLKMNSSRGSPELGYIDSEVIKRVGLIFFKLLFLKLNFDFVLIYVYNCMKIL